MTEDALIKQCQSGDKSAFERLLNLHYDTIYRFAYRWCGDQHNAEDITQLACIKLARSIYQFEGKSSFTSWLYRLVINCAKDFYKSPNKVNQREESLESDDTHNDDRTPQRLYAQQILEHINTLQDDLKDALVLVYGSGLSHSQAAERLNIKESTVSWRIHEARKYLKSTFSSSSFTVDGADAVRGST